MTAPGGRDFKAQKPSDLRKTILKPRISFSQTHTIPETFSLIILNLQIPQHGFFFVNRSISSHPELADPLFI
jgi:hypothetical protein